MAGEADDDVDVSLGARADDWDHVSVPAGLVDGVPSYVLPDAVKKYIIFFRAALSKSPADVEGLYEAGHKRLTERYFSDQAWPAAETIAPLVQGDNVFLLLYKELYFRHVYAKLQPSMDQRADSFRNYEALFKFFLADKEAATLELPERWLWDMIDEFVYQFQSFTQFRTKLANRTDSEKAFLREHVSTWAALSVLSTLHQLVEKSQIVSLLATQAAEEDHAPALRTLGYFAIMGLCRVHTLFGDYHLALKVLDPVELTKRAMYTRVPACQISLYYYVGFCYLMTRRYQDAVRVLSNILVYIVRTQHVPTRISAGYDNLTKRRDQLLSLLAIAVTLSPHRVDEAVHAQLMEKCGDRVQRMRSGDEAAIEELFTFGCPKFLSPVAPNYDAPPATTDPYRFQLRVFVEEAAAHAKLNTCRSYLRLYSTLPLAKLASFLNTKPEDLRVLLHNYKNRFNQVAWAGARPALSGARVSDDEVDFYIDNDMVHIADVKIARCYGEYFIHQINKLSA